MTPTPFEARRGSSEGARSSGSGPTPEAGAGGDSANTLVFNSRVKHENGAGGSPGHGISRLDAWKPAGLSAKAPGAPGGGSNPMSMDFLLDGAPVGKGRAEDGAGSHAEAGGGQGVASVTSPDEGQRNGKPAAEHGDGAGSPPPWEGEGRQGAGAKRKAAGGRDEGGRGHGEAVVNREPSPSRDTAIAVEPEQLRAEVEEMLQSREELREALAATDVGGNDWDWCKKRLIGNASRGSPAYSPWWGIFMETVPLSKRHVADDIRNISRAAPALKSKAEVSLARKDPSGRTWLQVGMNVEVKWGTEWWQAEVKKVKLERGGDRVEKVLVSYVGGTDEENEWIPFASRRLRPPTEAFADTSKGH